LKASDTIRIITEKRQSHDRFVPVQADVLAAIGEWISTQAQAGRTIACKDRLFAFGRTMAFLRVREAFQSTGIGKTDDKGESNAHPHTLRHTFAVISLAQGVPIIVLAEWLGHASIQNTLIYTKIIAQHSRHWAGQVQW
jgi:site-specific recombinase XerD